MKKAITGVFSLCLIFFTCTLWGQDFINSEELVGKWYLLESNKVKISDTLTLLKVLPKSISKDYSQWEFTNSNLFFITYYKHSQLREFVAVMENKLHDDVWSYEKANNHLTIKNDTFKHIYYLLSLKSDYIKLIKIE